ncbi:MAG: hypothetical protein IJV14_16420 [Lachnospiraceae bacterium]|nr:hypothetical protein [Lachnospiraceae bacterium]MBQ9614149.1 hypothetical protein [Lachnospiraceae bacterium]
MRENYLDQEIRNALVTAADHVDVSSRCKDRIDAQINCAEAMQSNGGSGHFCYGSREKELTHPIE